MLTPLRSDSKESPPLAMRWKRFSLHIIAPTVLVLLLFVFTIFVIVLPALRSALLEQKKETIRQLTNSAWSILAEYHSEEMAGELSREEAQQLAISKIEKLRYGKEGKDYFWITDMVPNMVVHPYRSDLNGTDVSTFEDLHGTRVFQEFAQLARQQREGYVQYYWQWKDNPERIVPKESYVKLFEPWNWVIGTGIYLEDVQREISRITSRLMYFCLGVTGLLALILIYVDRESLKIERQRSLAEAGLREWNEKYRALVEAATEGIMMVLGGACAYYNKTMAEMLGYGEEEFGAVSILSLLPENSEGESGIAHFKSLITDGIAPSKFETRLRRKNGEYLEALVITTSITFEEKRGVILIVRDISRHRSLESELGQTRAKYRALTEKIDLAVFRVTQDRNPRFIEANPAARRIFGIAEETGSGTARLLDQLYDADERRGLSAALSTGEEVRNRIVRIRDAHGSVTMVSLSIVPVEDDEGNPQCFDGIAEDVTARTRMEAERESLIEELQTSLLFLNQPVKELLQPLVSCHMNLPVCKAAALMTKHQSSAIAIIAGEGQVVGVLTDKDIRARILAGSGSIDGPVYEVMTSPVVSVPETALVFEAILTMQEHGIHHLAVRDAGGGVVSLMPEHVLLQFHSYSCSVLIREIESTDSAEAIAEIYSRLPRLVKTLVDCGAKARSINRIITRTSDAIVEKLTHMAIEECGRPPCRFAFVALGSEGRAEQTLVTDQDNAIIFEDLPKEDREKAKEYFLALGEYVCDNLHRVGYEYCPGKVMAKNPRWCQSIDDWRKTFSTWVRTANPQDLLEFNMFFDFRCVYGDGGLTEQLRADINRDMKSHPPFFLHFAQNTLLYKPPIGFLGKIVVESSGDSPKTFDIKEAMLPIVNYARIYALREQLEETNTLDRLQRLHERGIFRKTTYEEFVQAYNYLMQTRLGHQALDLNEGRPANNYINPKDLTQMEEALLKQSFSLISDIRKKISYDFLGVA